MTWAGKNGDHEDEEGKHKLHKIVIWCKYNYTYLHIIMVSYFHHKENLRNVVIFNKRFFLPFSEGKSLQILF